MYIFLAILGLIVGFIGLMSLSQATLGVGIIAFGCFLAILARIVQADKHTAKLLKQLDKAE